MRLLAVAIGRLMAAYIRLVAATCRIDEGRPTDEQVVLAHWHEYNLVATVAAWRLRRVRHHVSFSTQTFRGEVITALLAGLDTGSVPLPAERDRAGAARLSLAMARLAGEGAALVVTPDGPFGPYRRAKPGALLVAREAGLPVRAWAVAARPALRLRGRWDGQIVPLPFCRVRAVEAELITVEPRVSLRPVLNRLQAALDEVAARADAAF